MAEEIEEGSVTSLSDYKLNKQNPDKHSLVEPNLDDVLMGFKKDISKDFKKVLAQKLKTHLKKQAIVSFAIKQDLEKYNTSEKLEKQFLIQSKLSEATVNDLLGEDIKIFDKYRDCIPYTSYEIPHKEESEPESPKKNKAEKTLFALRVGVLFCGMSICFFIGFFPNIAMSYFILTSVLLGLVAILGFVVFSHPDKLW